MIKFRPWGTKSTCSGGHMFRSGPSRENMKKPSCLKPQGLEPKYLVCRKFLCVMRGRGRVLLCTQRGQLDCPPPNGLNHYHPLNKTDAHSTGERFRATMALLFLNKLTEVPEYAKKQFHMMTSL